MKRLNKLITVLILVLSLAGCCSTPTPIIIKPIPQADVSSDMSINQYLYNTTKYGIEITAYIQELINQIKNKVPYIEINREQKKEDIKKYGNK